ncbi:hypothetical protein ANN_20164 [Periplaneta americana]|uniref:Uncharacterized protein n=1 Tax=Periplaneta americana TaxID=6978 RepID=A0ABQ8SCY3_PERAM|nr:hypothetical protein ANN_20164 [Periplaneta americana]
MAGLCEGGNEPAGSLKASKKRPLGRQRRRWEDNIKIDLREVGMMIGSELILLRIGTDGGLIRTHRHDTTVHDVIRLLIPALHKNQSDSLMAADGDCHHLCKLMAPVRHRWSINDVIGGIRNTVMPSDCSALRFGIRSIDRENIDFEL